MTRPYETTHTCCTLMLLVVALSSAMAWCEPAFAQGPAAVRVAPVESREVVERRMVTGELVAVRRSRVASRESGVLLELFVTDGQAVQAGEVLAQLDTRRLSLRRAELEADVAVNVATIAERTAERDRLVRDLALVQASFERGAANEREIREAESDLAVAEARLAQSNRQVEVLDARIALIDMRLADATIKAPYDGTVIATSVETGEWVGEGDAVVEMLSKGTIEAWIKVPERFLASVKQADEVEIEIAGHEKTPHRTTNLRVIPDIDRQSHSFFLVATLDDPDGLLPPGLSLRSWVPTERGASRLLVHRDAILRNDAGPYVFVARVMGEAGPQAVPTQVRVLFPVGTHVAVEAGGLQSGDVVVIEGNERLAPMMPIMPVQDDASAAGSVQR